MGTTQQDATANEKHERRGRVVRGFVHFALGMLREAKSTLVGAWLLSAHVDRRTEGLSGRNRRQEDYSGVRDAEGGEEGRRRDCGHTAGGEAGGAA